MKTKPDPQPIEYRQLLALARDVLLQEPTMPDGEWKERIKRTLVRGGWKCPLPDKISQAMTQVEQSLQKTLGPRPVVLPPKQQVSRSRPQEQHTARTSRPEGWDLVSSLMAKCSRESAASAAPGCPRETWAISEAEALNEFWRAAREGDRLRLLQGFAEIALVREAEWNPDDVRAAATDSLGRVLLQRAGICFACRAGNRQFHEHHIIQLQHGGSDTARNRVLICDACHRAIHPWLTTLPVETGWTGVSDLAKRIVLPAKIHTEVA